MDRNPGGVWQHVRTHAPGDGYLQLFRSIHRSTCGGRARTNDGRTQLYELIPRFSLSRKVTHWLLAMWQSE
jgi:hypothetical protein